MWVDSNGRLNLLGCLLMNDWKVVKLNNPTPGDPTNYGKTAEFSFHAEKRLTVLHVEQTTPIVTIPPAGPASVRLVHAYDIWKNGMNA